MLYGGIAASELKFTQLEYNLEPDAVVLSFSGQTPAISIQDSPHNLAPVAGILALSDESPIIGIESFSPNLSPTVASLNLFGDGAVLSDGATTAWVNAVVSAGGSVSQARQNLINSLIVGLKSDDLWTKLDRLWIFAAENSESALIDLVSNSTASLVATNPTFTADEGYTGNASGYIDTGFNPTVGTNKFVRNDAHWSLWSPASQTFDNNFTMCGTTGTTAARWMYLAGTSGHYRQINDNGTGSPYTNPPSFVGHILVSRPSSTTSKHYHDGSIFQTAAATSTGVTNGNFCVLWDGGALGKSSIQAAALSIGSNLDSGSDASNLYDRLHTYMTAVGL